MKLALPKIHRKRGFEMVRSVHNDRELTPVLYAPFICFAIAAFFKFRAFERLCEMNLEEKRQRKKQRIVRTSSSLLNQNDEIPNREEEEEQHNEKSSSSPFNLSFWVPIESWVQRTKRCLETAYRVERIRTRKDISTSTQRFRCVRMWYDACYFRTFRKW